MSDLLGRLKRVRDDLDALGYQCALVGGFAVGLQVRPRTTKDIDLVVAVEMDAAAEAAVRGLFQRGYRAPQLLEHDVTQRLATARLCMPGSDAATPDVDLLFASCGVEPEIVAAADRLVTDTAGEIRVARVGHLIAMKVLSEDPRRPQDAADLTVLVAVASERELDLAREALALIDQRGYARGKALQRELGEWLRRIRRPRPPSEA